MCGHLEHNIVVVFSMGSKSDRHASYEVGEGRQFNINLILIEFDMTWGGSSSNSYQF